jgi:parallel beta-helix repeat protein
MTILGGVNGPRDLAGNTLAADKVWTIVTGSGSLTPREPLVIDGQSNITIKGVYIKNLSGPCIVIRNNSQNIRIENSELGPCMGAVNVDASSNITVDNVYMHDAGEYGDGIDVTFSQNVTITNNRMERVRTGVYALGSRGVRVERNTFLNMMGPIPRGQFVQFNQVSGPGNRILCNVGENLLGQSRAEDAINMYSSNGESYDPIQIVGNRIRGGGPSLSGGGILLGDGGGSYQVARDNIVIDPGQYGMSIAGGHDMTITGNRIYARQQPFTNVGIAVWNQYQPACYNTTVQNNSVNWTNRDGVPTPYWDGLNCGSIAGWQTSNVWNASISASEFDVPVAACTP